MEFFELIFQYFAAFISCTWFIPVLAIGIVGLIFILVMRLINDKY